MPIRNPFARRPGVAVTQDENIRPGSDAGNTDPAHPGFERVNTVGSRASSAFSIRSNKKGPDTGEYKMSVVNDSGVYLPPSPVEKEAIWPRKYLSRNSTDTRSSVPEIEHFSISRESFDSYRRSFDISAKSPISPTTGDFSFAPRQSLDSARFPRMPRQSMLSERRFRRDFPTPEESFEEVGLNDDKQQTQPAKKRGFFSKFGSDAPEHATGTPLKEKENGQAMSRFLPGRKRGQSGQGAELMPVADRPSSATATALQEQEVQS
ncbi:hypothetical protein SMACR_00457 [Sordaria macrospora]|uniref:WGS project CABT00000000 data, contig 2.1 n=2 Tax=Sordaria macrospora TaxID=5147 RepID=F7VL63_SORMK|nr:uncharacterized protein SMAC_00457 [Sordaria macrospora k-hell]KAA8631927.1 hypothetical protein SMACR_00457 [Sordaria macrospora]KAH7627584.1 hypothetical protein B0T09DRAFT_347284 [Sordaria sp. MPI-SDFR-AT-0083]WPJ59207.1 hypothetical protein SMAC4_00457 [Sordaria macrospora]CCC06240.1 unnamed protein product [Sordaria macrospora k-hell]